ncbi:MAG TPA: winged helix-turn-helix transcriptional regulator [Anaerolineaceae bacterium]|nr:winged helix-turn-helix transcriptional regulator [Anaerolineaceae bacterium]
MNTKKDIKNDQLLDISLLIGGKWKLIIIRELIGKTMRFGELKRSIGSITHKVLTDNLQALEKDGIIKRVVFPESTLKVEYSLTPAGYKFAPLHRYCISCYYDYLFALNQDKLDNVENDYRSELKTNFYEPDSHLKGKIERKNTYTERISRTKELIKNADHIIIGTGSGIDSNNNKIDHFSKRKAQELFPNFFDLGLQNIDEMINAFSNIYPENENEYWEFWAKYIWELRYNRPVSQSHKYLADIVKDKDYYVISTNSDGQLEESRLSKQRIHLPLGNYSYLQCTFPCHEMLYESKEYIEKILNHLASGDEMNNAITPHCPQCGNYLIPNHYRVKTISLVESNNMATHSMFCDFINKIRNDNNVFLEIGCGLRLPSIIRHRFENYLHEFHNTYLIRINRRYPDLEFPKHKDKFISFEEDTKLVLEDLSIE